MSNEQLRKEIQAAGMGLVEKKFLKTSLQSMHKIAAGLRCHPDKLIINLRVIDPETKDLELQISNSENGFYVDETQSAQEIEQNNPMARSVFKKIGKILVSTSNWWETEPGHIQFKAFMKDNKLKILIKCLEGPKKGEVIPI